jgi:hypothetical protein
MYQNVENIDRDQIDFTLDNIRPVIAISDERVAKLAASIKENAGRGVLGSGLERPVRVYLDDTRYLVLDGQERVVALDFLGVQVIPCEIVEAPADIWQSTKQQILLHDVDPFDIFALVERAVRLHNTPTVHGTETTWADVCAVMGRDNKFWSHHQHLLQLIPELREDVLAGRIRADMAVYIGRDLPSALQEKHRDHLLANGKQEIKLRATIAQILALASVAPADDDDEEVSLDDLPSELSDSPDPSDAAEVAYLLKKLEQFARRLSALDTTGFEDEIERIANLL